VCTERFAQRERITTGEGDLPTEVEVELGGGQTASVKTIVAEAH
jgi:hypothetical protein